MTFLERCVLALVPALAGIDAAFAEEVTIDLAAVHESAGLTEVEVVLANDPAYDAPKRYRGYRLSDVLADVPDLESLRDRGDEFLVAAADGYTVAIPWEIVLSGRGVVAVRDLDAPAGADWIAFRHDRREVLPAPFYLVWEGGTDAVRGHYWPYQALTISIRPFASAFGAAAPKSAEAEVRRGFVLFKDNCISCHSLNLVGGVVGPELNVPRNVLEYWRAEALPAFIRDASRFHARSRMPSFTDVLTEDDIAAVVRYLGFMAGHKLCDTVETCG